MTQQERRMIVDNYRAGRMSAEEIKEYEAATNGMPMEEIVSRLEEYFERKDYTVHTMTINELKKIVKYPGKVTEADRLKYEKYNGCSFEMVITLAEARTAVFDNNRENRQRRGLEQRIQRKKTFAKQEQMSSEAMAARGIWEYDEETGSFASHDFVGMNKYGSSTTVNSSISPCECHYSTYVCCRTFISYIHVAWK
jgi:hypothetical protein